MMAVVVDGVAVDGVVDGVDGAGVGVVVRVDVVRLYGSCCWW